MPADLKSIWCNIPPDAPRIAPLIQPILNWLAAKSRQGDYVLIQGDFGACFLMVTFAFEKGLTPVYAATQRKATETDDSDGGVHLTHHFKHRMFRQHGC